MKTRLQEIVEQRRSDWANEWAATWTADSETELVATAAARTHFSLTAALRLEPAPRILAETKRRSPSAGSLRASYDPGEIAAAYRRAGAVGISVLTEPRFFGGSGDDLRLVRARVDAPILCKDFIFDHRQLVQAAAWGADVALLIAAALDPALCRDLYAAARDLRMDVVVEVHEERDLNIALACADAIVGVNHRDLRTLKTDLTVSRRLRPYIPAGRLAIAESGLRDGAAIRALSELGYDGFLIGESLLRQPDPGRALEHLIRDARSDA